MATSSRDFTKIYKSHVVHVYAFIAYRVPDRHDAEDLTQLTFERALRAWDRFDGRRASPLTWLLAIARNALIDHQRRPASRSKLTIPLDSFHEREIPDPSGAEPEIGLSVDLASAVARLGQREQEVIALRFGADLDGPAIADALELSLANVHQIASRALRKLRAELDDQMASGPIPATPSPASTKRTRPGAT